MVMAFGRNLLRSKAAKAILISNNGPTLAFAVVHQQDCPRIHGDRSLKIPTIVGLTCWRSTVRPERSFAISTNGRNLSSWPAEITL
jgi:hypothetical protein